MDPLAASPAAASTDFPSPAPPSPVPPPAPIQSLRPYVSTVRVSSVLSSNSREYGKQHLFDPSPDTCWNSEQGSPQSISLTFSRPVDVSHVVLTFQGGFVGRPCEVALVREGGSRWEGYDDFDTRDDNGPQTLTLSKPFPADSADGAVTPCRAVVGCRLRFPASTDFFGRVTLYALDLLGRPTER